MDVNCTPIEPNEQVLQLLARFDLPVDDIASNTALRLYGCRDGDQLAGVVGLELLGDCGLIRSLAVDERFRSHGLGQALVAFAERVAADRGTVTLYLLTTTASEFFERLGYRHLSRDQAPDSVRSTAQFSGLCPATAQFLYKPIRGTLSGATTHKT